MQHVYRLARLLLRFLSVRPRRRQSPVSERVSDAALRRSRAGCHHRGGHRLLPDAPPPGPGQWRTDSGLLRLTGPTAAAVFGEIE